MKNFFTLLAVLVLFIGCHEKAKPSAQANAKGQKQEAQKPDQEAQKAYREAQRMAEQKAQEAYREAQRKAKKAKKDPKNPSKDLPAKEEAKVKCFKCGEVPISEVETFGPCSACKADKSVRHIMPCSGYRHKKCGSRLGYTSELEAYFRKKK